MGRQEAGPDEGEKPGRHAQGDGILVADICVITEQFWMLTFLFVTLKPGQYAPKEVVF